MKVQLLENLRYFEADDTDFTIQVPHIKELPDKFLRSYSIKFFLFTGRLKVVEGETLFNMKYAKVFVNKDCMYGKEFGKYFTKNLEFDTITFIEKEKVPKEILAKLDGETDVTETKSDNATPVVKPDTKPVGVQTEKPKPIELSEPVQSEPKTKVFGDLNNDGAFDEKDKEIAKQILQKPIRRSKK